MPVYDAEEIQGIIEQGGKVRCQECMEDLKLDEGETPIFTDTIEAGDQIYICDYCGKQL